jgi:hypothetical protein
MIVIYLSVCLHQIHATEGIGYDSPEAQKVKETDKIGGDQREKEIAIRFNQAMFE